MDMFLSALRRDTRFSLSASRRGTQTSNVAFAARGSSDRARRGRDILTPLQNVTPNITFGIAFFFWEYIVSVTWEVINCSDASWEQSAAMGFIIQVTPKVVQQISQPSCCQLVHPAGGVVCGGRLVGVKALDSSVERLWFNLQTISHQFLLSLQSNIPRCLLV